MRRELVKQVDDIDSIKYGLKWAEEMLKKALLRGPAVIRLSRPTRNLDQNAKMWALLGDISKQVEWDGRKLIPDDWKDIFTAALKEQQAVPGLNGGIVFLGSRSSKLTVQEFSDLIEIIYSFGAECGIQWSEKSKKEIADFTKKKEIINLQKVHDYEVCEQENRYVLRRND